MRPSGRTLQTFVVILSGARPDLGFIRVLTFGEWPIGSPSFNELRLRRASFLPVTQGLTGEY